MQKRYTPNELSKLGIIPMHPSTICALIRSGELQATNMANGNRRIYVVTDEQVARYWKAKERKNKARK